MKKFVIKYDNVTYDFTCDSIYQKDGIIECIINHKIIAEFKKWDCWYEKPEEEEKNRDTTK